MAIEEHLLPGAGWRPRNPHDLAGKAAMDLRAGRISREEFENLMVLAERQAAGPTVTRSEAFGYA